MQNGPTGLARRHPVFRIVLDEDRRDLVWLARETGFSHSYVKRVSCGGEKGSPRFRAKCAEVMGRPEAELFLLNGGDDGGASGARTSAKSASDGTAGGPASYAPVMPLSTGRDRAGGAVAS